MHVVFWSNRVIRWGFYLLFGLVPLLLTPWNYELFEYNKMMAVYALTVVIASAWLVKSIAQGEFRIARTPLDIPIALFVASQLVSSMFSIDPHVSWFGYYSRFNGGMLSIISYVFLYYAFVSNYNNYNDYKSYIRLSLVTAAVVAIYGVAERLGVDRHLWVQDVQNRVFSTLGQPNWLAAYLVALMPVAMAMGMQQKSQESKVKSVLTLRFFAFLLLTLLLFIVLLFTRSRSGLLGFVVADVMFWGLVFARHSLAKLQESVLRAWRSFIVLHGAFVILGVLFGPSLSFHTFTRPPVTEVTPSASYAAPLLETGGTESGTIRKYVWQGAIDAWRSSPKTYLIGTGTETFAFAFYQHRPKEHNLTSEWDFLYNKAHNEYLNYLATTGILGLGSYLLFIAVFIFWFIKQLEMRNFFTIALFAGWISILVTNFFGFSVVVLQLFLFLFPAMIFHDHSTRAFKINGPRDFFVFLVLLVSLVLLVLLAVGWYADTLYASGYRESRMGQYDAAERHLSRALTLNPGEPLYADELGSAIAGLVPSAIEARDATKAAQLVKRSLGASDLALSVSPRNANFWKTRTKMYHAFSEIDPAFNDAAIAALEEAQKLSPNDPKITYNLAILYGRKAANDTAIALLRKTIALKPNYRDAYYALWVFYTEIKKPDLARDVLKNYLAKVDAGDKDFMERLKQ